MKLRIRYYFKSKAERLRVCKLLQALGVGWCHVDGESYITVAVTKKEGEV